MPKQIKVTDELYERLKARANGQPIPKLLRALLDGDEGEALLEQLDAQSNDPYTQYRNLDDGELPECCQGIYSGLAKNRCEHWEWVNGGWKNKITNKYASDGEYVNYMENR